MLIQSLPITQNYSFDYSELPITLKKLIDPLEWLYDLDYSELSMFFEPVIRNYFQIVFQIKYDSQISTLRSIICGLLSCFDGICSLPWIIMNSNQQILQNIYEAFNKREIETIMSRLRPDVK